MVELSPRATAASSPSDLLDGIVAELRAEFNETSTSKNRTLSSKAVAISPKGASYYSALVAVGASYT